MPKSRSLSDVIGAGRASGAMPIIRSALQSANAANKVTSGSGGSRIIGGVLDIVGGGKQDSATKGTGADTPAPAPPPVAPVQEQSTDPFNTDAADAKREQRKQQQEELLRRT